MAFMIFNYIRSIVGISAGEGSAGSFSGMNSGSSGIGPSGVAAGFISGSLLGWGTSDGSAGFFILLIVFDQFVSKV
jgi:hypothetical protein